MTLFKDIKEGYSLHTLIRTENGRKYAIGSVVHISDPYFPTPNVNNPSQITSSQPYLRFLDITLKIGERTTTYAVMENSSMAEGKDGTILATDRDYIIREVESIQSRAESGLREVPNLKKDLEDCKNILEELKPELAEKRQMDKRLSDLEGNYRSVQQTLNEILKAVRK